MKKNSIACGSSLGTCSGFVTNKDKSLTLGLTCASVLLAPKGVLKNETSLVTLQPNYWDYCNVDALDGFCLG